MTDRGGAAIERIAIDKVKRQSISFDICTIKELQDRFAHSVINLYQPHRIEFHGLTIFTSGEGYHEVDFERTTLSAGSILPCIKGQVHAFEPDSQVQGFVMSFDESYMTAGMSESSLFHFLQLYYTPHLHIGAEHVATIQPYIDKLILLQNDPNTNLKSELIQSLFTALLLEIKRYSIYQHRAFQSQRYRDFIRFQELIVEQYAELHQVRDYAEQMMVSYKYLNDICKDLASMTAKSFLDKWLIVETKRKLLEQKYSSQELAYAMGFTDPSNFVRFFKKHQSMTPTQFLASLAIDQ